jgi:hypothetical protein
VKMPVVDWVKGIVDEVDRESGYARLEIGRYFKHPDGRTILVVKGQYWGTHGLSNHWTWKRVLPDGSLGAEEWGYGIGFSKPDMEYIGVKRRKELAEQA